MDKTYTLDEVKDFLVDIVNGLYAWYNEEDRGDDIDYSMGFTDALVIVMNLISTIESRDDAS